MRGCGYWQQRSYQNVNKIEDFDKEKGRKGSRNGI
jgi:hypothetical protein